MRKFLGVAVSLFSVLLLGIYFRCYPVFFPQILKGSEKAVWHRVQQDIAKSINDRYPQLPDIQKARLFAKELAEYRIDKKGELKKQVRQEYERAKDNFQDKKGNTYLMELDCWHWARYVQNIDRLGHVGDVVRDGKQHDNLMLFPQGSDMLWNNFFYYLSWSIYKVFSFFYHIGVFEFLFYLPLFFMAVFLTILFFFCYRYWGNLTAIICCVFVSCGPIFLPRSCAGWFDMDILSMIYSLLIVWTYVLAYHASSWQRRVLWTAFSAFWLGLFCATWIGWPFIFFIIILYEIVILADAVSERVQYGTDTIPRIKMHLVVPALFVFTGAFWIILFSGLQPLQVLLMQTKDAVVLNKPLTASVWPNVYYTVGELKQGDYLTVSRAVGGIYIFGLIMVLMLGLFVNIKKYQGIKREWLIILVVWFMTMFLYCSRGIRFAMFLLIPMGIALGWGMSEAYRFFTGTRKFRWAIIPLSILLVWIIGSTIKTGDQSASGAFPLMDDNWYSTMRLIKKHTPADSVISSWWDYGDFFKVVGGRRVIFDGQSQNTPQAYWMARVLLTNSEKEAISILRMLYNGGNRAFELTDKKLGNPFLSVSLIKRCLMAEPQEGKVLLSEHLPPETAEEVAGILYSRPSVKGYFVTDQTMIGKIHPISYLGNWDFAKVYLRGAVRKKPKEEALRDLESFGFDRAWAERYFQEAFFLRNSDFDAWVSARSMISGIAYQNKSPDDLVLFNNGYIYNPGKKTMHSYSSYEGRYRVPRSLFLEDGGNISEQEFPESDSSFSALLTQNGDVFRMILLTPEMGRSMFVRMHLLNGRGLEHFIPFIREGGEENRIQVFEIKWD